MRRVLLVPLISLLSIPVVASAAFSDVPASHPNATAIQYVQDQGIVSGYSDGTYRPDQVMNRAEFTKIIMGAVASAEQIRACDTTGLGFSDVASTAWYAPYVCLGKARGIIIGHLASNAPPYFAPSEDINLIEAAKILTVAMGIGQPPLDCAADNGRACQEAAARGENWYERHVTALVERNAVPLSILDLMWHKITRGEMAEMVYRLKANVTTKPSRTYDELQQGVKPQVTAWDTYRNDVLGYQMDFPKGSGLMSNSYAITDDSCAPSLAVGPLSIDVRSLKESTADDSTPPEIVKGLQQPLKERVQEVWQKNVDEIASGQGKQVGSIEQLSVNGLTAYRFWLTGSYSDIFGGQLLNEKAYVVFFDDGDRKYHLQYDARDAAVVKHMLDSWHTAPVLYAAETPYEAAQKCDAARR